MAHREQLHGRTIQASGLNRRGPFPVARLPGLQYLEPPSVLEMMEHRAALQDADTQILIEENQRLLAGHQTLRHEIDNTEKEIRMIQADRGNVEAVSGMQMSELVGKIRKLEAEIRAGPAVKKELLQVHLEAGKIHAENRELSVELQKLTEELVKAEKSSEVNKKLHAELDGLKKEYQSLRSVFEYSRDINIKQVEQMKTMEVSLIDMTKLVEKLRAEVQNAEMTAQGWTTAVPVTAGQSGTAQAQVAPTGTSPYGIAYNNLPAAYQQTTQARQYGMAQAPAASAVNYSYASPYAYFPAAAYQQATQAWSYTVPYADANPMACHQAVQASGYAYYPGANYDQNAVPYYPGYPAAYDQNAVPYYPGCPAAYDQNAVPYFPGYPSGYNQNLLYYYPVAYAAPQYTVTLNGAPTTDAGNMDGNAEFPAGQVPTRGGTTAVVEQGANLPSDGANHPNPTGDQAQM